MQKTIYIRFLIVHVYIYMKFISVKQNENKILFEPLSEDFKFHINLVIGFNRSKNNKITTVIVYNLNVYKWSFQTVPKRWRYTCKYYIRVIGLFIVRSRRE